MSKLIFSILLIVIFTAGGVTAEPPGRFVINESLVFTYNGEASRFLIHMSHAGWTDEIVKSHTTPEMFSKYPTGSFLKYKDYGNVMGFKGIYELEGDQFQAKIKVVTVFEKQEVDVEMVIKLVKGKYLIDQLKIEPTTDLKYDLNAAAC